MSLAFASCGRWGLMVQKNPFFSSFLYSQDLTDRLFGVFSFSANLTLETSFVSLVDPLCVETSVSRSFFASAGL